MNEVLKALNDFLSEAAMRAVEFFNEAELQQEIGYWLRTSLPSGSRVYFERPATTFFPAAGGLAKKEIDLVAELPSGEGLIAIELKCPRNGKYPETMFEACRDVQFLEQLVCTGFSGGLFIMHVDDPCFYKSGSKSGIYAYFRAGMQFDPKITQPTGSMDRHVNIRGSYRVSWQPYGAARQYYWLQAIASDQYPR